MSDDPFAHLKAVQREAWAVFAPLEAVTTMPAAELVRHARVLPQQSVLDVGCGTGVVALTAARLGARVRGLDLAPALIEQAKRNAALGGVEIDFQEGDVEGLPYGNATFDVVLSQFGHMFAPRPEVAIAEMLRVLKPGGTIAFSTWPPEHFVGQMFALVGKYQPPPPGAAPPPQWGDPSIIRERLGKAVTDIMFDRGVMCFPALSPQHYRKVLEETLGPVVNLVQTLQGDASTLASFRAELDGFVGRHLENNMLRQHYLMTRAIKC
ncbi:class I SAM-dependent methyltransferase [Cupriavidus sp. WKF15]|uniref:class I SAM-dependent methyltransferase n=1 Tax=Cupriavidus sp. WKF15 TaxID=3032282 RepID=UPI0023E31EB8|nr:class I SAM-dependent methyltransferase [Cupriavidus sp. WKF15]WER49056.1 class I SAM-dependent methyltransferase [Cupriavidus sp. WKF15]